MSGEVMELDDWGDRVFNDDDGENDSRGLRVGDECIDVGVLFNCTALAIGHFCSSAQQIIPLGI